MYNFLRLPTFEKLKAFKFVRKTRYNLKLYLILKILDINRFV